MADKQNNDENKHNQDEYRFDELDALETPSESYDESMQNEAFPQQTLKTTDQREQIIRKSLMVGGGLVTLIVLYKLFTTLFVTKPAETDLKPVTRPIPEAQPFVEPTKAVTDAKDEKLVEFETKINAFSVSNQNTQDRVGNLNNQVQSLSSDVSRLNQQLETLNQSLQRTQAMIQSQSQEIARLLAKSSQPRQIQRPLLRKPVIRVSYAIQAVIPGRAWLIGSNGSTITVRDGSVIPGYGRIKMIDSVQGKIYTTSGRMIEFSPQDS